PWSVRRPRPAAVGCTAAAAASAPAPPRPTGRRRRRARRSRPRRSIPAAASWSPAPGRLLRPMPATARARRDGAIAGRDAVPWVGQRARIAPVWRIYWSVAASAVPGFFGPSALWLEKRDFGWAAATRGEVVHRSGRHPCPHSRPRHIHVPLAPPPPASLRPRWRWFKPSGRTARPAPISRDSTRASPFPWPTGGLRKTGRLAGVLEHSGQAGVVLAAGGRDERAMDGARPSQGRKP